MGPKNNLRHAWTLRANGQPGVSQPNPRHDIGYSFEDTATGKLRTLSGDTIGVQSGVTLSPDPKSGQFLPFSAKDVIATSTTKTANEVFSLDFLTQPGNAPTPLFVTSGGPNPDLPPQPIGMQPNYVLPGTPVAMGAMITPTRFWCASTA